MKVLYHTISDLPTFLEKSNMKIEELVLPGYILSTLRADLDSSNTMLPVSARTLQEWKVGLLNR